MGKLVDMKPQCTPRLAAVLLWFVGCSQAAFGASELRLGLIGLDTSHVIAFTRLLNDTNHKDHVTGGKVVAAFAGGSSDIESSYSRDRKSVV